MQHLFTKEELMKWWLPSLSAVFLFVSGIVLNRPVLLLAPFVILALVFYTKNIRSLYFSLLFAIPLSTEFSVTQTLSTDLPDEPMMILLSGALLAIMLLKPSVFPASAKKSSLFLLVLLQLLWMTGILLFSFEPLLSVKYFLAKTWFLLAFVFGGLVFLKTKDDFKIASKLLIFSMLIPVLSGLTRHAVNGFSFASINETVTPFFRNHVNYSALLVCLLPVLFAWHRFSAKRSRKWIIVLILLFLTALFFSYARGAWLCLLSGAVTWIAIKRRFLLSLIQAIVMLTVVALLWLIQNDRYLKFSPDFNTTTQHTNFSEHLEATYTLKDMSTIERFYRWIAGVRMVEEQPITGYGTNTFNLQYKQYTVAAFKTWVSDNPEQSSVHNYFLLVAIEQGIPGLLLLCILLFSMFSIAVKGYHTFNDPFDRSLSALCGVILSMIVTLNFLSDLIETDKIGSIFFILLGIFIYLQVKMKEETKPAEK